MATKRKTPTIPPEGITIPRKRRATTSPKAKERFWTPAEAREMAKLGGRPLGSTTSPIRSVSAYMLSVFLEPDFQDWFRWRAKMGYLKPAEIQNVCYFAEGRPTYKVEVTKKPIDPSEAADRAALLAMSLEERRAMTDSIRKFNALRAAVAIPQTTQPVAEDAEITTEDKT